MTLGSGRSPGEGHGDPLQYSCLENPHGQRGLAGYNSWGLKELDTTEWITHTHETDRQPVSHHGSAFLGKGQPKMPRQLVTRDLNLKSGEGRIQNLVSEPATLGRGIQACFWLLPKHIDPWSGRFLGSRHWWNRVHLNDGSALWGSTASSHVACTLRASCLPFFWGGGGLFLLFGCYRVHLLSLKPGGAEVKGGDKEKIGNTNSTSRKTT